LTQFAHMPKPLANLPAKSAELFPARILAVALRCCKKTAATKARHHKWPSIRVANRDEFAPPEELLSKCRRIATFTQRRPTRRITVLFDGLTPAARVRALCRAAVIAAFDELRSGSRPMSCAIATRRTQKTFASIFPFGSRSLDRWRRDYREHGLDGLSEQKRGRVGRRKQQSAS